MNNLVITFVIGTYNRLNQINNCLSSLIGKIDFANQIIVIDAGSMDGTIDFLKKFNEIKVILEKKIGQAKSYNKIFYKLKSKYVIWLSDDNIVIPEEINKSIISMENNPSIGMIGLKVKDITGHYKDAPYIGGITSTGVLNVNQGIIRVNLLKKIRGFCEEYKDYCIDQDLTTKVLLSGFKVAYTKEIAIYHDRKWANYSSTEAFKNKILCQKYGQDLYNKKYSLLRSSRKKSVIKWIMPPYFNLSNYIIKRYYHVKHFIEKVKLDDKYKKYDKNTLSFISILMQLNRYNPLNKNLIYIFFQSIIFSICYQINFLILKNKNEYFCLPLYIKILKKIPYLGTNIITIYRDLINIKNGDYIKLNDLWINRKNDFYLVQKIDDSIISIYNQIRNKK